MTEEEVRRIVRDELEQVESRRAQRKAASKKIRLDCASAHDRKLAQEADHARVAGVAWKCSDGDWLVERLFYPDPLDPTVYVYVLPWGWEAV
jgi:hypothetical protein